MSDQESGDLSAAVQDKLAEALGDAVLLKYVAAVEVIDSDGERALWLLASPDCKAWDSVGMLQYALHTEMAATMGEDDS